MKVVLQPLNEKAADIVVNHVDLLRTPYIDPLLLQVPPLPPHPSCLLSSPASPTLSAAAWGCVQTLEGLLLLLLLLLLVPAMQSCCWLALPQGLGARLCWPLHRRRALSSFLLPIQTAACLLAADPAVCCSWWPTCLPTRSS
jgi:hypothetical protein